MERHAYIILAHNEPKLLRTLLQLVDDVRNDIYLHVDKKADIEVFGELKCTRSKLIMLPRMDVSWGGDSQMRVELMALAAACEHGGYVRYHIISGVDLPLKSQDYIHDFFDIKHPDEEFVGFASESMDDPKWKWQWEYPYYFADHVRDSNVMKRKLFSLLRRVIRGWYVLIGGRQKFMGELKRGCNWVSVTHAFADWLVERRVFIEEQFKHVLCADEKFIQTAIWNSPFRDKLYGVTDEMTGCMRAIDWDRGCPYVWRMRDLDDLKKSDKIFARKFSTEEDSRVVEAISDWLACNTSMWADPMVAPR